MGRIRGRIIRSAAIEVLKKHKAEFTGDFEANKEVLNKVVLTNKTNRNKLAGFLTKLARSKKIEEFMIEHASR